jgi:Cu+-exporting ATPase
MMTPSDATQSAIDPVCGMTVNPATAAGSYEYEGTTYYFCNPGCRQKFQADARTYLDPAYRPAMPRAMSAPVQLLGKAKSLPVMMTPAPASAHIDPVCGMTVDPATAAGKHEHNGTTYYFCSAHCLRKFQTDPEAVLHPAPKPQTPAPAGTKYICPMDPEVVSDKPGACPKCGMALEPDLSTAPLTEELPNPELEDMTPSRRHS